MKKLVFVGAALGATTVNAFSEREHTTMPAGCTSCTTGEVCKKAASWTTSGWCENKDGSACQLI